MIKLGIENYKKKKMKSAAFVVAELRGFKIGVDSCVPFTSKVTIEPALHQFCYRIQFFDWKTGVPWMLMGVFVKSCESDKNRLVCIGGEYYQKQLKQSKNTSLLCLPTNLNNGKRHKNVKYTGRMTHVFTNLPLTTPIICNSTGTIIHIASGPWSWIDRIEYVFLV